MVAKQEVDILEKLFIHIPMPKALIALESKKTGSTQLPIAFKHDDIDYSGTIVFEKSNNIIRIEGTVYKLSPMGTMKYEYAYSDGTHLDDADIFSSAIREESSISSYAGNEEKDVYVL